MYCTYSTVVIILYTYLLSFNNLTRVSTTGAFVPVQEAAEARCWRPQVLESQQPGTCSDLAAGLRVANLRVMRLSQTGSLPEASGYTRTPPSQLAVVSRTNWPVEPNPVLLQGGNGFPINQRVKPENGIPFCEGLLPVHVLVARSLASNVPFNEAANLGRKKRGNKPVWTSFSFDGLGCVHNFAFCQAMFRSGAIPLVGFGFSVLLKRRSSNPWTSMIRSGK